jgi:hypothetical protein
VFEGRSNRAGGDISAQDVCEELRIILFCGRFGEDEGVVERKLSLFDLLLELDNVLSPHVTLPILPRVMAISRVGPKKGFSVSICQDSGTKYHRM